jgi:hypothetical protein
MNSYTEDERVKNFDILLDALKTMEGGKITEDWMEEHKLRIWLYRSWFTNLSVVNYENKDPQYRAAANIGEECLSKLVQNIKSYGTFDVPTYLKLSTNMKFMVEYHLNKDDLAELMKKINLQ